EVEYRERGADVDLARLRSDVRRARAAIGPAGAAPRGVPADRALHDSQRAAALRAASVQWPLPVVSGPGPPHRALRRLDVREAQGALAAGRRGAALLRRRRAAGDGGHLLSAEHFTVDGTLIEAWASLKSFRPKNERPEDRPPPDDPGNPTVHLHGARRSNATHASISDRDALLAQGERAGGEARLRRPCPHDQGEDRAAGAGDGARERVPGLQGHGLRQRQLLPLHGAVRAGRRGGAAGAVEAAARPEEPGGARDRGGRRRTRDRATDLGPGARRERAPQGGARDLPRRRVWVRTKVKSPQTNGICERFHKTVLKRSTGWRSTRSFTRVSRSSKPISTRGWWCTTSDARIGLREDTDADLPGRRAAGEGEDAGGASGNEHEREPETEDRTITCQIRCRRLQMSRAGVEPATRCLKGSCSAS